MQEIVLRNHYKRFSHLIFGKESSLRGSVHNPLAYGFIPSIIGADLNEGQSYADKMQRESQRRMFEMQRDLLIGMGTQWHNPTQMVILSAGGVDDPVDELLHGCDLPKGFTGEERAELREFIKERML